MTDGLKPIVDIITESLEDNGYQIYDAAGEALLIYDKDDKPLYKLSFTKINTD